MLSLLRCTLVQLEERGHLVLFWSSVPRHRSSFPTVKYRTAIDFLS